MYTDYDAYVKEKTGGRPEFVVGGQKFTARGKIPWKKFSAMMFTLSQGSKSTEENEKQTEDFFRLVLVSRDRQRFIDLLNYEGTDDEDDDDNVISSDQVNKILDDLMDYFSGKVKTNEDDSSNSPPDTGAQLNVVSLNPKTG